MTVIPPILFSVAALASLLTLWSGLKSLLPAITGLRAALRSVSEGEAITVRTRDPRAESGEGVDAPLLSFCRRRALHPKPVTHRLHHFRHPARAA